MARNKKSLMQAKAPSRSLAACGRPLPEPRAIKRAIVEQEGQKLDDAQNDSFTPYKEQVWSLSDETGSVSIQGRSRRRYDEEERLEVAATRARGACSGCRATKTKCRHDSSKNTTDQYQSQSESHERFALGLTTESLVANEDEHKQMMGEKIAAFDDKLVRAQDHPLGQNHNGNYKSNLDPVAPLGPSPPPARMGQAGLLAQNNNHRQAQSGHMSKFRVSLDRRSRGTNIAPCKRQMDGPKVLQPNIFPNGNVPSTANITEACDKISSPSQVSLQFLGTGGGPATPKKSEPGCKSFLLSTGRLYPKVSITPSKSTSEYLTPSGRSDTSEEDCHTMVTDPSISNERSPSPSSDRLPSNIRQFVKLSELERSKPIYANDPCNAFPPDTNAMEGIEFSYEEMLNSEDIDLPDLDERHFISLSGGDISRSIGKAQSDAFRVFTNTHH